MNTGPLNRIMQQIRSAAFLLDNGGQINDDQLLECFLTGGEEAAFQAIVTRHGPMVLGACRRILGNSQDVEDAFQATFLVLVRKARSLLPRRNIGNWLYGVACKTALKSRAQAARRHRQELQAWTRGKLSMPADEGWNELLPMLDRELARLPGKYREPVVLCDLESKTRKEAARQLGLPEGTVSSRLARGRSLLTKRLSRYRLAISSGALAGLLAQDAAAGGVPAALVTSTVEVASLFAACKVTSVGTIPVKAIALAEGVLKAMLMSKLQIGAGVLVALGIVTACTEEFLSQGQVQGQESPLSAARQPQQTKADGTLKVKVQPPSNEPSAADRQKIAGLLREAADEFAKQEDHQDNRTIADIAVLQSQIGDNDAARASFARAKELNKGPIDLRELAEAYARAGDLPAVLAITATLPQKLENWTAKPGFRNMVLAESGKALAEALRFKEALQVADQIEDPEYKALGREWVQVSYAYALAKAGKLRDAEMAVESSNDPAQKVMMLVGRLEPQFTCWDYPQSPGIAIFQARAGEREQATQSLRQAGSLLPKIPEEKRAQARAALTCAYSQLGDLENAKQLLDDYDSPQWRSFALASYVKALAVAGKTKEAEALLAPLEKGKLVHVLYLYATGQYKAGDREGAKRSIAKAHSELAKLADKEGKLHYLILAQAITGDAPGALAAALTPNQLNAPLHFEGIAYALAENGDYRSALEVANRLQSLRGGRGVKGRCIREIAKIQASKGKEDDALVWIKEISSSDDKAMALLGVAKGLAQR